MRLVRKKRTRNIDGFTQDSIIKLLKKEKKMRFSDIQNKIGISKPVLWQHLINLKKEKSVDFVKHGREKHYFLSKNAINIPEKRMAIFSSNYEEYGSEILIGQDFTSYEAIIEQFRDKLVAITMFSIIKSMETGENWIRTIDLASLSRTVLFSLTMKMYHPDDTPNELDDSIGGHMTIDFQRINSICNTKNMKNKLKDVNNALKIMYPEETKVMEWVYKHPGSSWVKALEMKS